MNRILDKKCLIVGAGLTGATIARLIAEYDLKVDIIDQRDHLAGNCYDFLDENGFLVHKYGPHLFHTSKQQVIDFLSKFTEWVDYKHKVKALLEDGRFVTLPVNRETVSVVGEKNIIKTFFKPYTKKMWGLNIEEINPEILKRVPIRDDYNEFYFPNDAFQKLPHQGYTAMIERMLEHKNINIKINTPFNKSMESEYLHIFNSMAIDEYFDYCYGRLPYRSIKFHSYTLPIPKVLPVATVNFTHDGPYTRVTEWKILPNNNQNIANKYVTKLTVEEPCDYLENNFNRFYPIKDVSGKNNCLYQKYKELIKSNMTFIGRCGTYTYIDMDDAVANAFQIVKDFKEQYGSM